MEGTAKPKTWDGLRWIFVVLAAFFVGLTAWLAFHEQLLESDVATVLWVPIGIAVALLLLVAFACDDRLQRVAAFFIS